MNKSLEQVKADLSEDLLREPGIHAIGLNRAENSIVVYVEKNENEDRSGLRAQLEARTAPYQVILIEEEPPQIN